jgi:2-polyprenyl-6-methoxyphenol hydroxylase-like FAD-dependent oxidoreductase
VGAEGTNSVVRGLIAPDAKVDDIGGFIYGRTPITDETLDWMPEILVDSFNRMMGPDGVSFGVATCRPRTPYAEAVAEHAPGTSLTEMPGYLAWGLSMAEGDRLSGRLPLDPEEFRDADGPTLHRVARETLEGWPPEVLRIVDEADVAATFPVSLRSSRPVAPWRTGNVTLVGDAIHTMSPGRGEGANVALKDARLLRDALVDVAANGTPLAQATSRYQADMLQYGFQAVAASLNQPFAPPRRA